MNMHVNDSLGNRMKDNYENITRYKLVRRMPVIIRLDMRAGHTFTRGMKRPYDMIFKESMWATACALCEQIQNVQLAYVQSDEISLLLIDYKKLTTSQWFDGTVQKMASVSAAIATIEFNKTYMHNILIQNLTDDEINFYSSKINGMTFDSRVFNIPESEVCNYFYWRQLDATRNSIQSAGQYYFSQKELHKIDCNHIQEKLMTEKNVNWNDYPTFFKRGVCTIKEEYTEKDTQGKNILRSRWVIDKEIPIFSKDRNYIEKYLIRADDT